MLTITPYKLAPAIPVVIAAFAACLTHFAPLMTDSRAMATALTIDLTLMSPLLYWLVIRKSPIPNITVVPVFIVGILLAGVLIPAEQQVTLTWMKRWLLPIVELAVIGVIGWHFVTIRSVLTKRQTYDKDFYSAVKAAVSEVVPGRAGAFLAMELATFYYGFLHWEKAPDYGYTYHKSGGSIAILSAIMLLIPIETVILHLLIQQWSTTAAWIVTILSIYTALQLLGMIRSIKPRPIVVFPHLLKLRFGILAEADVALEDIDTIERINGNEDLSGKLILSPLGSLEGCNVLLRCKREQTVHGLYGMRKKGMDIALRVDEAKAFMEEVQQKSAMSKP